VETKITESLPASFPDGRQVDPINTYDFNLENTKSNQTPVTVTENEIGGYWVVFELWQRNDSGSYIFTHNYCTLNIQVTA
jgi:predicted carbohydrate-binding protein with CBM5 and CBM33 domain